MKVKNRLWIIAITVVFGLIPVTGALAHKRAYPWTYEYGTAPYGETEVEYYFTSETSLLGEFTDTTTFKHWIELEHSITDHFDMSVYQMFIQESEEPFKYEGFKIRARYRISESGVLPVDPLIYLEYIRKFAEKEDAIEGKIILAKDIGILNMALNLVGEYEYEDGEWELSPKGLLASSVELTPFFRFGAEYEIGWNSELNNVRAYLGPAFSIAFGSNWTTVGIRWGVTEKARDLDFRLLIGIEL